MYDLTRALDTPLDIHGPAIWSRKGDRIISADAGDVIEADVADLSRRTRLISIRELFSAEAPTPLDSQNCLERDRFGDCRVSWSMPTVVPFYDDGEHIYLLMAANHLLAYDRTTQETMAKYTYVADASLASCGGYIDRPSASTDGRHLLFVEGFEQRVWVADLESPGQTPSPLE